MTPSTFRTVFGRAALAVLFSLLAVPSSSAQQGKPTNPAYLIDMPTVDRVKREVQGSNPQDTALRQMGTFWQLGEIIKEMSGPREFRGLTPDEQRIIQDYYAASYYISQAIDKSLTTPEQKRQWANQDSTYHYMREDRRFGVEGIDTLQRFFSPNFRALYQQALAAEAARHQQFVKAGENAQAQQVAQAKALAQTPEGNAQIAAAQAEMANATTDPGTLAARRCVESGRNPLECVGEGLSTGFSDLVGQVAPGLKSQGPAPGLRMNGVFPGQNHFALTFYENNVSVACGTLVAEAHAYKIAVQGAQAQITVQSAPKPIVLTVTADNKLAGPGAVPIAGQIITGYKTEYEYNLRTGVRTGNTRQVPVYAPSTQTCTAGVMASTGSSPAATGVIAAVGSIFGMDQQARQMTGAKDTGPIPVGLRLTGSYAGQGGMTVEFHPDVAVVGCGQATLAHAYAVGMVGNQVAVKIQDASPILLAVRPDGSLNGSGSVTVNGRKVLGTDGNNNFIFAPVTATCPLGVLAAKQQ